MKIGVVSLFPEMFAALNYGITGRAQELGLVQLSYWNPRDEATDPHRTVDDRPYGGGPGMLMKVQPLLASINKAKDQLGAQTKVIYLTPQGRKLDQASVKKFTQQATLILVAGRYEGIDERLINSVIDEEWSIGDYILSGGEIAAMVIIDGVIRLLPGALGEEQSAQQDSFSDGLLDCPHYTRPREINGMKVPEVLMSGDHVAIARWRMQQALGRTWLRRPELIDALELTEEQKVLLEEFKLLGAFS